MAAFTRNLRDLRAQTLSALATALDGAERVALLDLPTHMNVGDSMILAGELSYLRELQVQISYDCDIARFHPRALRRRHPFGPILLHGGGNFGDTWPQYQQFRESIISQYRGRRIVQLPQSVYFADERNARRCRTVLEQHPDFVLMCRDSESIQRSKTYFPNTNIVSVPDMALGWQPTLDTPRRNNNHRRQVVVLARRDHESAQQLSAQTFSRPGRIVQTVDWGLAGPALAARKFWRIPGSLSRRSTWLRSRSVMYPILRASYRQLLHQNLRAGQSVVSAADVLVSDRLHAHILACLLKVPNVVLDNSYGKISAIFQDYTGLLGHTYLCSDPEEAGRRVADMIAAAGTGDAR